MTSFTIFQSVLKGMIECSIKCFLSELSYIHLSYCFKCYKIPLGWATKVAFVRSLIWKQ